MTVNQWSVAGFVLDAIIGRGGGGLVVRGVHVETRTPCAVKFLGADRTTASHAWLDNEIKKVARLSHPNIVHIFDVGEVSDIEAKRSDGRLQNATPYIAMEIASGGSLNAVAMPLSFSTTLQLLAAILRGLAHAHARGIAHRDLKPSNILLCTDDDPRPGVKISDFGLALDGASDDDVPDGGTPLYMAPETSSGRVFGPAVDLYAVGCIAHQLLTGVPPFVSENASELRRLHQQAPIPSVVAAGVPKEADVFLNGLLAKHPDSRFPTCADALDVMRQLFGAASVSVDDGIPKDLRFDAVDFEAMTGGSEVFQESSDTQRNRLADRSTQITPKMALDLWVPKDLDNQSPDVFAQKRGRRPAPPIPSTWRHHGDDGRRHRLLNTGQRLFTFLTPPFVGREQERDDIWRALVAANDDAGCVVVGIAGASGLGKSRLSTWLLERAHEVAGINHVFINAGASEGASVSIARGLARALKLPLDARGGALVGPQIVSVVDDKLSAAVSTRELSALLSPYGNTLFRTPLERQAAAARAICGMAHDRVVIVVIDDVGHDHDHLDFVAQIAERARDTKSRVLVVVTVSERVEEVSARASLDARIDALVRRTSGVRIALSPFDPATMESLIDALIPLAPSLVADLRARTDGNPFFLVQVLGDLVAQDVLVPGRHGYALKRGTTRDIPMAAFGLWEGRIAAAIDGTTHRAALEVLAALGAEPSFVEWDATLTEMRIARPDDLAERLASCGLGAVSVDDERFQFAHGMVREAILRHANVSGRLSTVHDACARSLESLYGADALGIAGRIGRHLMNAERYSDALTPLLQGAEQDFESGEAFSADALLSSWNDVRERLAVADHDAQSVRGLLLSARVAERLGRSREARRLAAIVIAAGTTSGDEASVDDASIIDAAVLLGEGTMNDAASTLRDVISRSRARGDVVREGIATRMLGDVEYYRGRRASSATCYVAAERLLAGTAARDEFATCLWSLGYVVMGQGDGAEALRLFRAQLDVAKADGDRFAEGRAENALGELARRSQRFEEARVHYERAVALASVAGSVKRFVFRLNIAHTSLAEGDVNNARIIADDVIGPLQDSGDKLGAAAALLVLATCAAHREDFPAFDRHVSRAWVLTKNAAFVDEDLASCAEAAGEIARRKGENRRAIGPLSFAREKYLALGESVRATRLARTIDDLSR